nr:site-specific integrase [Enterococcus casseliflavus]
MSCRIKGLSKETMSNKFFAFKGFVDYLESIEVKEIEQIKKHDIQKYIENQLKKGLKARTINNRLKNIKVFFDYCEEEEFIKRNPFTRIKMLKEETHGFKCLTMKKYKKYLDFIILNRSKISSIKLCYMF